MKLVINNKFNNIFKDLQMPPKPYIIAEIGVNHEGSISRAFKLIDLAKNAGADAVKFQTYKADKLASKNSPYYWDIKKEKTQSQNELFKKYDSFEISDYVKLSEYCNKKNIEFFTTPFDNEAVHNIDKIVSFYKIASADITSIPLLKTVAKKKKPVLLSVGASNLEEIKLAIKILKEYGSSDIGLLHCVLNYPTKNIHARLNKIIYLREIFPDLLIGYSDHTLPSKDMKNLIVATLLGAKVIEKHFTDDKTLEGNDHYHAMDHNDLSNFIKSYNNIYELFGSANFSQFDELEVISRKNARRSIVIEKRMSKGEKITEEHLTYKRPGNGIEVVNWEKIIGKKINKDLNKDHILKWEDLI